MTLFPMRCPKPKSRPTARDRAERRLPTGAPRLVESSRGRFGRASTEAWQALLDAIRQSTTARLALLSGRSGSDQLSCPWERVTGCDISCRCSGSGAVAVKFLRKHYASLADEIALLGLRAPARRRRS